MWKQFSVDFFLLIFKPQLYNIIIILEVWRRTANLTLEGCLQLVLSIEPLTFVLCDTSCLKSPSMCDRTTLEPPPELDDNHFKNLFFWPMSGQTLHLRMFQSWLLLQSCSWSQGVLLLHTAMGTICTYECVYDGGEINEEGSVFILCCEVVRQIHRLCLSNLHHHGANDRNLVEDVFA